jgi:hypothetical protein
MNEDYQTTANDTGRKQASMLSRGAEGAVPQRSVSAASLITMAGTNAQYSDELNARLQNLVAKVIPQLLAQIRLRQSHMALMQSFLIV